MFGSRGWGHRAATKDKIDEKSIVTVCILLQMVPFVCLLNIVIHVNRAMVLLRVHRNEGEAVNRIVFEVCHVGLTTQEENKMHLLNY